jgi:5-methylcytosine-specific restriction endonuclease McrA
MKAVDPFYLSPAWRAARARQLRSHPHCTVPGCQAKATHVDHIKPRARGGAELDPANLQTLCHSHHSSKTARFEHPNRRVIGCDADGWPLTSDNEWRT